MSPFRISDKTEWLALGQPFSLESGRNIPGVEVA